MMRNPSNRSRIVAPFNSTPAGSFYADPVDHGGWVANVAPEHRAQWGREGAVMIRAQVDSFDVHGMPEALRKRDPFTTYREKKYGSLLPSAGH